MILNQFVKKYNGKQVEVHGSANARNQCVDLVNAYIREVLGLDIVKWTNAKDFPEKVDDSYIFIPNTPLGIPKKGDIVVWNGRVGGGAGHISIYLSGGVNSFKSFDQNWSIVERSKIETHNYKNIRGWLHPKKKGVNYMQISQEERDFLVNRSVVAKETAKFLGITGDPDKVGIDEIKKVIGGIKGRVTELEGKLGEAEANATNRTEQVSRLKAQLLEQAKLYKGLSDKLKSTADLSSGTIGLLEGRVEALQNQVDTISAEKGKLVEVNALLKVKREYDVLTELARFRLALVKFR